MATGEFGSVRKRDNGRWQARWEDRNGHQHSRTFPTRRAATDWLAQQATDRNRGEWTDPRNGRMLFGDWQQRWRSTVVDLRQSTLDRDLGYLDRYIADDFDDWRLEEIDPPAVEAWVARMNVRPARVPKDAPPRTLAPATVVKAGQLLGKIMEAAVRARMIPANPCADVRLPRVEIEEMRFLEPDEMWALADAIDPRYRAIPILGAGCGLRPGEMFGLRVGRVEQLRRRVQVAEIVVESDGHLYVGPPKTKAGRRSVPAAAFVLEALRPHLAGKGGDDLVFPAPKGGHVRLASWRQRYWKPALKTAGLDSSLRVHDLRHTAVAWWIAAGADPVDIAKRAGHRSVVTVLDRYGHLLDGREDEVTDRLDLLAARRPTSDGTVVPFRRG